METASPSIVLQIRDNGRLSTRPAGGHVTVSGHISRYLKMEGVHVGAGKGENNDTREFKALRQNNGGLSASANRYRSDTSANQR